MISPFHPSVSNILFWLRKNDHLPEHLQEVSDKFASLGIEMANNFEGPEVDAGMRKLLEASDCFVRAAVAKYGDNRRSVTGIFQKDD